MGTCLRQEVSRSPLTSVCVSSTDEVGSASVFCVSEQGELVAFRFFATGAGGRLVLRSRCNNKSRVTTISNELQNLVAVGLESGNARLWQVERGELSSSFALHNGEVKSLCLHANVRSNTSDPLLLSGGVDGQVHVRDLATHERRRTLLRSDAVPRSRITVVQSTPDETGVFCADSSGRLRLLALPSMRLETAGTVNALALFESRHNSANSAVELMCFHPHECVAAIATDSRALVCFEMRDTASSGTSEWPAAWPVLSSLPSTSLRCRSLCFSRCGSILLGVFFEPNSGTTHLRALRWEDREMRCVAQLTLRADVREILCLQGPTRNEETVVCFAIEGNELHVHSVTLRITGMRVDLRETINAKDEAKDETLDRRKTQAVASPVFSHTSQFPRPSAAVSWHEPANNRGDSVIDEDALTFGLKRPSSTSSSGSSMRDSSLTTPPPQQQQQQHEEGLFDEDAFERALQSASAFAPAAVSPAPSIRSAEASQGSTHASTHLTDSRQQNEPADTHIAPVERNHSPNASFVETRIATHSRASKHSSSDSNAMRDDDEIAEKQSETREKHVESGKSGEIARESEKSTDARESESERRSKVRDPVALDATASVAQVLQTRSREWDSLWSERTRRLRRLLTWWRQGQLTVLLSALRSACDGQWGQLDLGSANGIIEDGVELAHLFFRATAASLKRSWRLPHACACVDLAEL
ncbi:MAG: hypothetical protein MHM6MM_005515 [Cercozoa sp. M6MM]